MWEKTTNYFDGNHHIGQQIEGGPSWYDYILGFPSLVLLAWKAYGFYAFFIPIVLPYIVIRDWWTNKH